MTRADQSHARRNALTGDWVLVSPHRLQRPWQGLVEVAEAESLPEFDPDCYLCPGNERANGNRNPNYRGPFTFDNDFPALTAASEAVTQTQRLFEARAEAGCCRVVCYSERHDLRLATMSREHIVATLAAMSNEFARLDRQPEIGYVQIFENRGAMMGCSNPHPHAQVWATTNIPTEPAKELRCQNEYLQTHGRSLLLDYLQAEMDDRERIVVATEHYAVVVPYWAVWPFEMLLSPRRAVAAPDELDTAGLAGLAEALGGALASLDRLFGVAAPYSLGFHARPSDGRPHPEWQFHVHIYPPLLRSATIRKHLVGFEMLGMPQRDLTPEVAARKLREAGPG